MLIWVYGSHIGNINDPHVYIIGVSNVKDNHI